MRVSVRALRGAVLNRRKSCGVPASASPFSQRRMRLSPWSYGVPPSSEHLFLTHWIAIIASQTCPIASRCPGNGRSATADKKEKRRQGEGRTPLLRVKTSALSSTKSELAHDLLEPPTPYFVSALFSQASDSRLICYMF